MWPDRPTDRPPQHPFQIVIFAAQTNKQTLEQTHTITHTYLMWKIFFNQNFKSFSFSFFLNWINTTVVRISWYNLKFAKGKTCFCTDEPKLFLLLLLLLQNLHIVRHAHRVLRFYKFIAQKKKEKTHREHKLLSHSTGKANLNEMNFGKMECERKSVRARAVCVMCNVYALLSKALCSVLH